MALEKGLGGHSSPIAKRRQSWPVSGHLGKKVQVNKRRDIKIGLAAAGIAIFGLISSLATSNRQHLFGSVTLADQEALLILAVAFGALTVLKWWVTRQRERD